MQTVSLRNQRGQASIFMVLFITTMIMLFAFTTNIGMLVHAKINLQNAADAAAYAGAAVQARQLTSVSYLNYEMRRALKEFLFLYTVRSQYAALPCFPTDASGNTLWGFCPGTSPNTRYNFAFFDPREGNNETGGPYLPTVCIIFDPENNYCQKLSVPGIPEFQGGGSWGVADPIVAAVMAATNQIIQKKTDDCAGRTQINRQFLIAWLFNVYPYQDASWRSQFTVGNDSDDPFDMGGLDRIGVLPRMAILRARVDNFEEALNLNLGNEGVGDVRITEGSMDAFKSAASGNKTLDYFERPIQAYLSAKNNLPTVDRDNGIFSDIQLTELIPGQATMQPSPDLKNPPILAKFNELTAPATFANSLFVELQPGSGAPVLRGNCQQRRELRTINAFPFGITKDPNVITYYAVRLQAKARLLFSPFGGDGIVTLSAYSAAKPFGSRIGKDVNQSPETMMVASASDGTSAQITGFSPKFPNALVSDYDRTTATEGFTTHAHLGYLRGVMLTYNRRDYGQRLAGAFAPWELGYYNPPANYDAPERGLGYFEDNPKYSDGNFRLIASINPYNQPGGSGLGYIRERVLRYLSGDLAGTLTLENQPQFAAFKDYMLSDAMFGILFGFMQNEKLVDAHVIPDPLLNDNPTILGYARANGQRFTVAAQSNPQKRQLTSWNNQKTASTPPDGGGSGGEMGQDIGRSGYSVRFVSFAALTQGGRSTNDPSIDTNWDNPLARISAAGDHGSKIQDDIRKLKH